MIIGDEGRENVDLKIPQGTSLNFTITHKDADGSVVDHSQSTAKMAFVGKDGNIQLDECCTCSESGIAVSIPASVSRALPLGKMPWDIMVTTAQGDVIRAAYGKVIVIDTYAHDGD